MFGNCCSNSNSSTLDLSHPHSPPFPSVSGHLLLALFSAFWPLPHLQPSRPLGTPCASVPSHFSTLALFPGSRAGEEEREPGIHCLRMRPVLLVTSILLLYTKINGYLFTLLKGHTEESYCFWDTFGRFIRRMVNFKGKNCISHVP